MDTLRPALTSGHGRLVLLVDDNPDTLEMYAIGLQYEGFDVVRAGNGELALEAIAAARPDCIVADVRMPRMTGVEFRRVLSRSHETAGIPVIALTGFSAQADIDTAQAAGFESVLLKPCLPERLAREIVRVLALRLETRPRALDASAPASQVPVKAAWLQDTNAESAQRHRAVRRRSPSAQ